jgi:hypothetical protein
VPVLAGVGSELQPLLDSLVRVDDALLVSLQSAVDQIGDSAEGAAPDSDLAAAGDAVQSQLDALAQVPNEQPALNEQDRALGLVQLDSRRQLVTRQLALEAWLQEWRRAEATVG